MGCDIHLWVEKRSQFPDEKGVRQWARVLPPPSVREKPWRIERGEATWETCDPYSAVSWATRWYDHRNYRTFAILADVRNGAGFAGCPTGDRITPISEPKGWPSDPSPEIRAIIEGTAEPIEGDVYPGDHSESWLSLRELNAYNWLGEVRQCGVIGFDRYIERVKASETGEPKGYCGATMGPGVVTIEEDEARERITGGGLLVAEDVKLHVRVWWRMDGKALAGDFYTRVLPALNAMLEPAVTRKYSEGGFGTPMREKSYEVVAITEDDIRIVFNFDS